MPAPHLEPDYDLIVRGAEVLDGTGTARFGADLGVMGDRIAAIGDLSAAHAREVLDASGRMVAPGFIDIHTHSDLSLLEDGGGESKVHQGVTTEVAGNCAMSPAPVNPGVKEEVRRAYTYMEGRVEWTWNSMREYLARFQEQGISPNLAQLVGHGTLRAAVRGFAPGAARRAEMDAMLALLERCLEEGAVGLSTGLIYAPSCFAPEEEIQALGQVVQRHGGIYATHMRAEGAGLLDSIEETLRVTQASGVRTQISHLKAAGRPNWGLVHAAVERLERARVEGLDVAYDVYPYVAGSTHLSAMMPPWAQAGGEHALLERLADSGLRPRLKRAMDAGGPDWPAHHGPGALAPEAIYLSAVGSERNRELVGRSLTELGALHGKDAWDAAFDLLLEEEGHVTIVAFLMSEEDVRFLLTVPYAVIGSDGLAIPCRGHWLAARPHPRFYGTFPRVLGHYARDERVLSLEQAVHKMTGLPAQRMGWKDRGVLSEGAAADLVVFDPDRVHDLASFEEPHRFAQGIEHVFVNGQAVVRNGRHTGARPGRVLHLSR